METLLDDLLIYELALLVLGVLLFLILSIGLAYYIVKNENIKKLLYFFPISIIMIGYPSIKEITVSKDKFEIVKYQQDFIDNPKNEQAREKLEEFVEEYESRAKSPEDIVQISKTNLLLGNAQEAIKFADKAIETEKKRKEKSPKALDINTPPIKDAHREALKDAIQLKQLAETQVAVTKNSDSVMVNKKIKNLSVDKKFQGTQRIVKKNMLRKINRKK